MTSRHVSDNNGIIFFVNSVSIKIVLIRSKTALTQKSTTGSKYSDLEFQFLFLCQNSK